MNGKDESPGVSEGLRMQLEKSFNSRETNKLAQTVALRQDIFEACLNPAILNKNNHIFNVQTVEVKPVTHQKGSGRCWIFACLNSIRIPFAAKYEVSEFEFSQNYVYFWDKLERAYFEMHRFLDVALKGEDPEGRLVQFFLADPVQDGGQWDMLVNVIEKYGLLPKSCWTEAWSCEASAKMNDLLRRKMRQFCRDIFALVKAEKSEDDIKVEIDKMLDEVYRILTICLGTPPKTFEFEYNTTTKQYKKIGPITPQEFYETYVKEIYNIRDKICLVNDPREGHSFEEVYTVDYLSNMVQGRPVLYLNLDIEEIKKFTLRSLKKGEAIWFGSHVSKGHNRGKGLADPHLYDFRLMFDMESDKLTKADRLVFGESFMTHAMVITAANVSDKENEDVVYNRWRVENSWGSEYGSSGYLSITDAWFTEFVYQVVVDKSYLDDSLVELLKKTPRRLPAWDPFGNLACDQ